MTSIELLWNRVIYILSNITFFHSRIVKSVQKTRRSKGNVMTKNNNPFFIFPFSCLTLLFTLDNSSGFVLLFIRSQVRTKTMNDGLIRKINFNNFNLASIECVHQLISSERKSSQQTSFLMSTVRSRSLQHYLVLLLAQFFILIV